VLRQSEGFERVQVFSPTGEPIEHAGQAIALSDRLRFWIRGASSTGRVVMSNLYVPGDSDDGKPVLDFIVTVMHDDRPNEVAGALVARIDPDRRPFQTLSEAVDATRDVSLTLARRESDAVAVLLPPTLRTADTGLYERLQRQFDQMATACIVLSAEGNVLQINPAHERVFGYAPQHLVGRNVREFVRNSAFIDKIFDWLEQLSHDPETKLTDVVENATQEGRPITCRWTGTALLDADGRFGGLIGMAEDITEQFVAERALRQARDHLEERVAERTIELEHAKDAAEHADCVKSAFLSTMSHELRTPLNSILGFTDVLLQGLSGPLTEAQQRQLQIVRDSSTHLRELIEDVLDISRIEAGQIGLEFAEVDLADIVARRVDAFGPEYARKGVALRIETEGAVPVIRSDRKRTAQIVNNLLSNALKFTDHGCVTVRLCASLDQVEMHVVDTGIGIPASALGSLFNPFTQVIRPGGRMHEGTGLGLAISRNLARALGGDITVVSEVGQGSRFECWLPLVPREVDAASASATFRSADVRRALGAV